MVNDEEAKLHIPACERGDTGKYSVKVKNEFGEDEAEIAVVVLGELRLLIDNKFSLNNFSVVSAFIKNIVFTI